MFFFISHLKIIFRDFRRVKNSLAILQREKKLSLFGALSQLFKDFDVLLKGTTQRFRFSSSTCFQIRPHWKEPTLSSAQNSDFEAAVLNGKEEGVRNLLRNLAENEDDVDDETFFSLVCGLVFSEDKGNFSYSLVRVVSSPTEYDNGLNYFRILSSSASKKFSIQALREHILNHISEVEMVLLCSLAGSLELEGRERMIDRGGIGMGGMIPLMMMPSQGNGVNIVGFVLTLFCLFLVCYLLFF